MQAKPLSALPATRGLKTKALATQTQAAKHRGGQTQKIQTQAADHKHKLEPPTQAVERQGGPKWLNLSTDKNVQLIVSSQPSMELPLLQTLLRHSALKEKAPEGENHLRTRK